MPASCTGHCYSYMCIIAQRKDTQQQHWRGESVVDTQAHKPQALESLRSCIPPKPHLNIPPPRLLPLLCPLPKGLPPCLLLLLLSPHPNLHLPSLAPSHAHSIQQHIDALPVLFHMPR